MKVKITQCVQFWVIFVTVTVKSAHNCFKTKMTMIMLLYDLVTQT